MYYFLTATVYSLYTHHFNSHFSGKLRHWTLFYCYFYLCLPWCV